MATSRGIAPMLRSDRIIKPRVTEEFLEALLLIAQAQKIGFVANAPAARSGRAGTRSTRPGVWCEAARRANR